MANGDSYLHPRGDAYEEASTPSEIRHQDGATRATPASEGGSGILPAAVVGAFVA